MKAKLLAVCGMSGSGKTTYAQHLEFAEDAVRFSMDQWLLTLYPLPKSFDEWTGRVDKCWTVVAGLAERLVRLDTNVVIDWSVESRESRKKLLHLARATGLEPVLFFLNTPMDECWKRVQERNLSRPAGLYSFPVSGEIFNMSAGSFQPPAGSEGFRVIEILPKP